MIRLSLITLLILTLVSAAQADYAIYVAPQIPEFITVNGPYGSEQIANVEQPVALPGREICRADNYSPYVTDPLRRSRIYEVSTGTATSAELFAVCTQARQMKEREIRSGGSQRLNALANPYSAEERETWPQQQAEALEFQSNPNCGCPMIRNMAGSRQIPLGLMAGKILENAALFKTWSGLILGQQQRLLDSIATASDFAALMAISWEAK